MNLPRELRRPLLIAMALSYCAIFINRHWGHWPLPPAINSYVSDLLALPLLLTVVLACMRHLYFRQPAFVLPVSWVLSTWLALSVWFEVVLPRWRPAIATADALDVVAYGIGGLIFWQWLNRPA
jgi:hypothetical protein